MDVVNGSTTNGTPIQQWSTLNGVSQMFNLLADGSNWHIVMNANNAKCIDLVGGGSSLGNGTRLMINDCKAGALSQDWTVTADAQTGGFVFKNAMAGRCLEGPGANAANGVLLDIYDCNGMTSQKFVVQAVPLN